MLIKKSKKPHIDILINNINKTNIYKILYFYYKLINVNNHNIVFLIINVPISFNNRYIKI